MMTVGSAGETENKTKTAELKKNIIAQRPPPLLVSTSNCTSLVQTLPLCYSVAEKDGQRISQAPWEGTLDLAVPSEVYNKKLEERFVLRKRLFFMWRSRG